MKEKYKGCYNPGDLLLPENYQIIIRKSVLIIPSSKAVLTNPDDFNEIVMLNLTNYSGKDEEQAIKETTS